MATPIIHPQDPPPPPSPPNAKQPTAEPTARATTTRRTRIVCISDTHNCTVKVPGGDVLIHSGDLTNTGSHKELSKQMAWLARQPHEVKIVVAGNHDTTLDAAFYQEHGAYFHHGQLQDVQVCRDLLLLSPPPTSGPQGGADREEDEQQEEEKPPLRKRGGQSKRQQAKHQQWIYLEHEARTVRLRSPDGPRTEFSVFGSPYTPQFERWAFQYRRHQEDEGAAAARVWGDVPLDTDVLVTHGPAFGHRDETAGREAAGCEALRRALWRVRPRLAVCGHIHEARGAERVRWDLGDRGVRYKEAGVEAWVDPAPGGGEKICLVDLTARGGKNRPLDNDGGRVGGGGGRPPLFSPSSSSSQQSGVVQPLPTTTVAPPETGNGSGSSSSGGTAAEPGIGTRGLGGDPDSARSDQSALAGRLGRRETCIVNAAIQASGYPHVGPRRLNKAIVVDLDLPVWEEEEEEG